MGSLALAACSGDGPGRLADLACREAQLPAGFERLTFGNLSRDELGREAGAEALASAGVEGGYFTYWKERRDALEDEPAAEIVCQVMAFGADGEAARFVASLPPEAAWLSVTVAGVALAEGAAITEVVAGTQEGVRAFRLVEGEGLLRHAVLTARGRFVLSVHIRGPEEAGALREAIAILETMGRR